MTKRMRKETLVLEGLVPRIKDLIQKHEDGLLDLDFLCDEIIQYAIVCKESLDDISANYGELVKEDESQEDWIEKICSSHNYQS